MRDRTGFSLVELLLALLLITVGLFPLLNLVSTSLSVAGNSQSMPSALNLARAKMEEIKNTPYDTIAGQAKSAVPGASGYSQEVQVSNPQTTLKDIKVIIYWKEKSSEKNLNLETLIAK